MRIQRCKGTRDLSPDEMSVFCGIEGTFRDCCLNWGYKEVRTPTIEYLHLFTSAGMLTTGMLSRVYSFLDWDGWSGERVVLRPDGTIPVTRLYIDNMQDKGLARLFYITNIFIFEETGKKNRERWQCGVELIGVGTPMADTELIAMSLEVLNKLDITGVEIRLSHAGLIKSFLEKLGLSREEQARLFDEILDGDAAALAKIRPDTPELESVLLPLLNLKGQSSGFLKNIKAVAVRNYPEIVPHIDDFISIVDNIKALGYRCHIDIASGAGFEYYTGVIFQLFVGNEKIGGGGRYDALIPIMGGPNIPASGFALYLDRLMNIVKPLNSAKIAPERVSIRIKPREIEAIKAGFEIARELREAGYIAEIDLGNQEPGNLGLIVDVRNEAPYFTILDNGSSKRIEVETCGEVIIYLKAANVD
jgi:histidyl-tRNA synthetase